MQVVVSLGVVLALVIVDGTVDLDDESRFSAEEVDDVRADRMLAAEAPPTHLSASKHRPEPLFGESRSTTLIASSLS